MKIKIKLKEKYRKELAERYSSYELGKLLNKQLCYQLRNGEEVNITIRMYYKLCKIMDWKFSDHFEVQEIPD